MQLASIVGKISGKALKKSVWEPMLTCVVIAGKRRV